MTPAVEPVDSTGWVPRLPSHLPALDGVRGVAIAMVLCVHFIGDSPPGSPLTRVAVKLANYGIWGVDLFFVLSGFLITGILHDTKGAPRYFRNFYVRRTLRIFPLYYAVLALLFVILPLVPGPWSRSALIESGRHQGWLWLYASNVYLALQRSWALPYVGHFWSLAVEEQFYLIWPVIVLALGRRKLLVVCGVATLAALASRVVLGFEGAGPIPPLVLMPCRLDALCVGAAVALAVRSRGLPTVARLGRIAIVPLLVGLLLTSVWNAMGGPLLPIVLPLRGTLIALTCGALLSVSLESKRGSRSSRFLSSRPMRFLGTISYGLYVFHGIVAYWMVEHGALLQALAARVGVGLAMAIAAGVGTGVSIAVATMSFELFEKPILRLKDRWAPALSSGPDVGRHFVRKAA